MMREACIRTLSVKLISLSRQRQLLQVQHRLALDAVGVRVREEEKRMRTSVLRRETLFSCRSTR